MCVDDLGKLREEEEPDAKSEFRLVSAISSEPTAICQARQYLQAELYLVPVGDDFNVLSCSDLAELAPVSALCWREMWASGTGRQRALLHPWGSGGMSWANISQGPQPGSSQDGLCLFASLWHLQHKVHSVNRSTVNICGVESETMCPQHVEILGYNSFSGR